MRWSPDDLDRLERAITDGARVQIFRRGTELIVIPEDVRARVGRDVLRARRVATGELDEFMLDEVDAFEVLDG
jgi:hypothetical protein